MRRKIAHSIRKSSHRVDPLLRLRSSQAVAMIKLVVLAALVAAIAGRSLDSTRHEEAIKVGSSSSSLNREEVDAASRSYSSAKVKPYKPSPPSYVTQPYHADESYGYDSKYGRMPSTGSYGARDAVYAEKPRAYHFEYKVDDPYSYNHHGGEQSSDDYGNVSGSYYVVLPDGRAQLVRYTADHYKGYVADVEYLGEPHYDTATYGEGYSSASKTAYPYGYKPTVKPYAGNVKRTAPDAIPPY